MITSYFAPKRSKGDNCKVEAPLKRLKASSTLVDLDSDVQELISHLTCESWKNALIPHLNKTSFHELATFVAMERKNKVVYPPPKDIFTALNLVPLHKVKVVIVGQDPYHQPNQGHGLAFSVRKGVAIPPSLRNIYKELLANDVGLKAMPNHGFLERWAHQGVLMLNSVLTVRRSEAFSHANRGWEEFTDEIIRLVVSHQRDKEIVDGKSNGVVFLLWGKPASKKAETIINQHKKHGHVIICSSHPSPLGATKTNAPFIGSKCFSRCNDALVSMGHLPICWAVDGDIERANIA
jgi:uracil-DNA glycosylase